MFSKFRKALLGGLLAVIIAIGPLDVSAAEINIKEISRNINNAQVNLMLEDIKNINGQRYSVGSYDYTIVGIRYDDNYIYQDVDIEVEETLLQSPEESAYFKGIEKIYDETQNENLLEYMKEFSTEIEQYINVPAKTAYSYTFRIPKKEVMIKSNNGVDKELFRRDYFEEGDRISPLSYDKNLDEALFIQGVNDARNILENKVNLSEYDLKKDSLLDFENSFSRSSGFYNRLAARDYAKAHGTDQPEYPSKQIPNGSDCANFVSKCLNHGGIPIDQSGKWYPASTWGGWPGDYWFRTGYNKNGGVVPYMTNKSYFYNETNWRNVFAGSILYRTNTSHVGLVTYGDGAKIKYSHHSTKRKPYSEYNWNPNGNEYATFYKPMSWILK